MRLFRWNLFVVSGAIAAFFWLTLNAVAAGRLHVVAATGQQAPNGTKLYRSFNEPALNDQGELAFYARLANPDGTNSGDYGIFRSDGANAASIVRTDMAGPGTSGAFGNFVFATPAINDAGQVAFSAELLQQLGDIAGKEGVFLGDGSTIGHVAVEGQRAPDRNGTFSNIFGHPINNSGNVGVWVGLAGAIPSGSNDRYYLGDENMLIEIARTDVGAPNGLGNIGSFRGFDINDFNQVSYMFAISGKSLRSIYRYTAGTRDAIAPTGQATPEGDGTFDDFFSMQLNDQGHVAFGAEIVGGSGDTGLYISNGTSIQQLVRSDTPSPDGNGVFTSFSSIEFNNTSQVAVRATLTGTTDGDTDNLGLFVWDETGVVQAAREGQTTPSGRGTLNRLDSPFFNDFALNDLGQLAFEATVSGAPGAHEGIFFFDPVLGLQEVVRLDDQLLGSQIDEIDFVGGRDEFSGLNNRGQVAFTFTLNDGTKGVAVWTIPEPSGCQLVALAVVAFIFRRRALWM